MTYLRLGSSSWPAVINSGSPVLYFSDDSPLTWGGLQSSKDITNSQIDGETGVALSINMVERVYDSSDPIDVCITADTTSETDISSVVVDYGGNTKTLTTRTVKDGVQGFWFTLDHSNEDLATPETRIIYATADNSRTVGKRFRVADASDITVEELSYDAPDLFTNNNGNNLHAKLSANSGNDNYVFEIGDGTWYLPEQTGVFTADQERWIELRAKEGTNPTLVPLPASINGTSNFTYGDFALRSNRLVLSGITIDTKYVSSFRNQGNTSTFGGQEYYLGFESCNFIDSVNNITGPICGYPNTNAGTPYQSQSFFRPRTIGSGGKGSVYELYSCSLHGMNFTTAHTYFDCTGVVSWDLVYIENDTYQPELCPGFTINKFTVAGFFNEATEDFKTPRLYRNFSGPRTYTTASPYAYDYNDILDPAEMTYTVDSVTEENNYTITGIGTFNKVWRVSLVSGDVFSVDAADLANLGDGSQTTYEWGFWRWSAGDALTLENRTFVGDPVVDGTPQYGSAYVVTTRIVGDHTELLFYNSQDSPDQANPGLVAGDRIAFGTWNHADGYQLGSGTGPVLQNCIIHDYTAFHELQPILVNNFSSDGTVDMVFNNCLFGFPKDSSGNPPADLGSLLAQFNATPHSVTVKYSTFVDMPIYFPHTTANVSNGNISTAETIDDKFLACVSDGFWSEDDLTPAGNWTIRVEDSVSRSEQDLDTAGKTADYWTIVDSDLTMADWDTHISDYGAPLGGGLIKTSTISSLPKTVDGETHTGQVGALSTQATSSWKPDAGLYFLYLPGISTGSFNPAVNDVLSVSDGEANPEQPVTAVSYQWYKNGAALSGETNNNYQVDEAGKYYECVVTRTNSDTSPLSVSASVQFGKSE